MGTKLIDEPGTPRGNGGNKGTTLMGGSPTGTRIVSPDDETVNREARIEPVVGWLAVIAGPGRGSSVEISYGMNIIGRGMNNRIILNFGDDSISQDDHFRIAYDGQNRAFHLVPGRGTNLVYIAGQPLLGPQALAPQTDFVVGGTTLRFVPLCTPDWDWSGQADA